MNSCATQNAVEHFKRIQRRLHRPATIRAHHRPNRNRVNGALRLHMAKKSSSTSPIWFVFIHYDNTSTRTAKERAIVSILFAFCILRTFSNRTIVVRIIWKYVMGTGTNRPFWADTAVRAALWNSLNPVRVECCSH